MKVLAFSCPHAPYHHIDALDFLSTRRRDLKPDEVVCLGDEADLYRFSSHEQDPDAPDVVRELKKARRFIADLGKLFPTLKLCHSNHVRRLYSAARRAGLPPSVLRPWRQLIEAPAGWSWRTLWKLDRVHYFHADGYSGTNAIANAVADHRTDVVFGHLHTLGRVEYHGSKMWSNWGASAGCLVTSSKNCPALRYGKYHRKPPVRGCVEVIDRVPVFQPFRV